MQGNGGKDRQELLTRGCMRRTRGRPEGRWIDCIKEDLDGKGTEEREEGERWKQVETT